MFEILHNLHIKAKPSQVYNLIATPNGLNKWWTKEAKGEAEKGSKFQFFFTEDFDWAGIVTKCQENDYIEWEMLDCDEDWDETLVGFELFPMDGGTDVVFYHRNWNTQNDHFKSTSYFWAMHLRLLKRYLEHDEFVPYDHRSNA